MIMPPRRSAGRPSLALRLVALGNNTINRAVDGVQSLDDAAVEIYGLNIKQVSKAGDTQVQGIPKVIQMLASNARTHAVKRSDTAIGGPQSRSSKLKRLLMLREEVDHTVCEQLRRARSKKAALLLCKACHIEPKSGLKVWEAAQLHKLSTPAPSPAKLHKPSRLGGTLGTPASPKQQHTSNSSTSHLAVESEVALGIPAQQPATAAAPTVSGAMIGGRRKHKRKSSHPRSSAEADGGVAYPLPPPKQYRRCSRFAIEAHITTTNRSFAGHGAAPVVAVEHLPLTEPQQQNHHHQYLLHENAHGLVYGPGQEQGQGEYYHQQYVDKKPRQDYQRHVPLGGPMPGFIETIDEVEGWSPEGKRMFTTAPPTEPMSSLDSGISGGLFGTEQEGLGTVGMELDWGPLCGAGGDGSIGGGGHGLEDLDLEARGVLLGDVCEAAAHVEDVMLGNGMSTRIGTGTADASFHRSNARAEIYGDIIDKSGLLQQQVMGRKDDHGTNDTTGMGGLLGMVQLDPGMEQYNHNQDGVSRYSSGKDVGQVRPASRITPIKSAVLDKKQSSLRCGRGEEAVSLDFL